MTRAKNKKDLTPEEKRAQAIVPPEEQPYKVPGNWRWVRAKLGFNITSSKRVHKEDWKSEGIPFYRTRELVKLSENGYVDNELFITQELYEEFKNQFGVPKVDDLLISGVGTIGIPYIVSNDEPFYFKDGNVIWFQNKGVFLSRYIYFLYKSTFMQNQLHEMSAGTTVETYTIINAEKTAFPLPPLSEQRRIVERIERLFARLDEAACKAQSVLASCEARKSAILHKAFTGELTAEWRKNKGRTIGQWQDVSLSDIIESFRYGTSEKSSYVNDGTPVLRIPNIGDGIIDFTDLKFLQHSETTTECLIHENDILLIRSNGSRDLVGRAAIVPPLDKEYAYASFLIRIRPTEAILAQYLVLFLNTALAREQMFKKAKSSAGIHNINTQELGEIVLRLPLTDEQTEIINRVENLLLKQNRIQSAAQSTLASITALKQSILARAFRGELGTNDPAEPAAEL